MAEYAVLVASGALCVFILLHIGTHHPNALGCLIICSTFVSRVAMDLGGITVRPEMVLGFIALIISMTAKPKNGPSQGVGALGIWVALWILWLAVVTAYLAPVPAQSLSILVWLTLDLAACSFLVRRVTNRPLLISTGVYLALASAVAALAVWLLATLGGPQVLVQVDPAYGGVAAYVGALEANILAGLVVLWSAIAQSRRLAGHLPRAPRIWLLVLMLPTALATHTRAALVAGLVVCAYTAYRGKSSAALPFSLVLGAAAVGILVSPGRLAALNLGKFTELLSFEEGTGLYRATTWFVAVDDLNAGAPSAWIHGLGLNTFGQRHLDPSLPDSYVPWYLGNVLMQVLYDGGLIGSLIIASVILTIAKRAGGPGVWAFVMAYLVLGLATSTLWLMQTWTFVAFGIWLGQGREHSQKRDRNFSVRHGL